MPYGKNKKLSAPRPKKKKVQAREDATYDALTACVTNEDAENVENLEDENKTLDADKEGAMANVIGTEDDANGDQGKDHPRMPGCAWRECRSAAG